jgi:hypothetical protein
MRKPSLYTFKPEKYPSAPQWNTRTCQHCWQIRTCAAFIRVILFRERNMLARALPGTTTLATVLTVWSAVAAADEFRILTKIYVGKEDQPSSQNVTIFRDGLVYDCMESPEEVAVFDGPRGRFILLNPPHRLRTEITFAQLETRIAGLQAELKKRSADEGAHGLSAFLTAPRFDESAGAERGQTVFKSPYFQYAIKSDEARGESAAKQYADFVHWYTRLNAMRNPAMLAREPINEWLTRGRRMPVEIELTTFKKGTFGAMNKLNSYRSHHNVAWALSVEDRKKLDEIDRWLVSFEQTPYDAYRDLQKPGK